jgi:predicted GIY-YIG superfamily endonuclease
MKMEGKEQVLEFQHTTDGKPCQNKVFGGSVVKSKTRWDKNRLITKSTSEGPMGSLEVIEARTLSEDGKTMTVEYTMKSAFMDWKRKLVYEKEFSNESMN